MNATTPHPAHDDLVRFGHGLLPADERQAIEAHVATCDECTAQLTALAPDSLAQLLRLGPQLAPCPDSTPLPPALGGLTSPFAGLSFPAEATPEGEAPAAIPEPLREHPRYRVLRLLGRGGMGNVYLAEHRHMGRMVALKVIDPSILDNPTAVRRFRQEVKAAAQLAHPNIVQAHDAEEAGGLHFLVLEYVPGQQLAAYAAEAGPLPYQEACAYAHQAALALQYAHGAGLVHRDVKPHNLMVTPDGRVKVLDFGLARVLARPGAAGASATQAGSLMGTPDYVAPEQARDAGAVDGRADVYSLGCTLYHLLTGRPPFPGGTAIEKVARHLTEDVPALDAARLGLPAGLAEVVARMTARDPGQRYQTAGEVAEALAPFATAAVTAIPLAQPVRSGRTGTLIEAELVREPAGALSQTAVLPASAGRSDRRRWWRRLAAVAAGVLFVAAALAAVVVYRIQTDKGELVIETVDDDVEVVVKTGGKLVTIYDPKTKQKLILRSGTYELELKGKPTGLKLDIEKATLKRGDKVIATIERWPPPGEIRRFAAGDDACHLLSPDGRFVLTGNHEVNGDFELHLWDVVTGKQVRRFQAQRSGPLVVAFSRDGKRIVAGAAHGAGVLIWDTETGKLLRRIPYAFTANTPHFVHVWAVAFEPEGEHVYVGGDFGTIEKRSVETGAVVRQFVGHQGFVQNVRNGVRRLAVSRDGRYLLSASDGKDASVRLWDTASGKEIRQFKERGQEGYSRVAFSTDARQVLTAAVEAGVCLWDVSTGLEVRRFEGHDAVFSPDGRRLLTASRPDLSKNGAKSLRLWDVATGKELCRFTDPKGFYGVCGFSPDGRMALARSGDNVLILYRLPDPPAARPK
jgi:WD40 repeat protein